MDSPDWDGHERRRDQGIEILNLHRRMTTQDNMLQEISDKLTAHLAVEASVKPSVDELIKVLNGIKFLRASLLIVAPVCAIGWQAIVWIKDHIKW